jgi:RHS repeat-associated protein
VYCLEFVNLYYVRARWLDALKGRWDRRDPIGYYGGDWNLYPYVSNSGVDMIDPTGMGGCGGGHGSKSNKPPDFSPQDGSHFDFRCHMWVPDGYHMGSRCGDIIQDPYTDPIFPIPPGNNIRCADWLAECRTRCRDWDTHCIAAASAALGAATLLCVGLAPVMTRICIGVALAAEDVAISACYREEVECLNRCDGGYKKMTDSGKCAHPR